MWFPGAACLPQEPEKHEMCVGTEAPGRSRKTLNPGLATMAMGSQKKTQDGTSGAGAGEQKQLVNSYFAKLYLSKSLNDSKKA